MHATESLHRVYSRTRHNEGRRTLTTTGRERVLVSLVFEGTEILFRPRDLGHSLRVTWSGMLVASVYR